ncbi:MAG TPA: ATP-binding protein [Longimicrobiales bacterium]|nr:ATP-binding protein [Longimicrobiales bacterium]
MMRAILANTAGATATAIALVIAARSASDWLELVPILLISAVAAFTLNFVLVVRAQRERTRLRGVALRALRVSDEDRRRRARDVNEEAAQTLASALLHLRAVPPGPSDGGQESIRGVRGAIVATMERLEKGADPLRPALLDMLGAEAALLSMARTACERVGIHLDADMRPLGPLADAPRLALLHIVQEAIDNVVDHAHARVLRLTTCAVDSAAVVIVQDDGRGFSVRHALRSSDHALGLSSMREMAAYWDGSVRIESRSGSGTCVEIRFPLQAELLNA